MTRDNKTDTEILSQTRFVLLLHSIPHLGEKTLTRLLHHNAQHRITPDDCLALSSEEWQLRYELDPRALAYLNAHRETLLTHSEELARTVRQADLHVLTPQSRTYPDRLERFDDAPPPILYALGNVALLDQTRRGSGSQPMTPTTGKQSGSPHATPHSPDSAQDNLVTVENSGVAEPGAQKRNSARKLTNRELYSTGPEPRSDATSRSTPTYQKSSRPPSPTIQASSPEPNPVPLRGAPLGASPPVTEPANPASTFLFSIAVSNGAAPATLTQQDQIAEKMVQRGCVPVTGHDRAAYKRLALSAQRLNRPVIYVMDRGLREALGPDFDRPPFAAARIRDLVFDLKRDLALSSFRLDDHALGANNRRRDRTIYALADVIIALDVRPGGAMVAECLRAHEQGRLVWVAPGGREGNEELRQAGCPPIPQ